MKQLDARAWGPSSRDTELLRTFDELPTGDAFVLIHDQYPKPLLLRLINTRAGQFEWNVLEAGPELFRVRIQKRAVAGPRGVVEYMHSDHARLEGLLGHIVRRLSADDLVAVEVPFREFSCGLQRHMRAEEEILFPVFERATGIASGALALIHREHESLTRQLEAVATGLATGGAHDEACELKAILEQHNMNEECFVYRQTDDQLGSQTLDQVVHLMQLV